MSSRKVSKSQRETDLEEGTGRKPMHRGLSEAVQ